MAEYIEFVADRLASQLGYAKLYYTKNPFDFMERISLEGKDNFFEKRVTTYAKANTAGKAEEKTFSTDADF
jgi:ribonucleotide reductase beta subunit family protein with ferritin-like domain